MSRLDFAPKPNEIEITDIKKGLGVFRPKPDRRVSFAELKGALKRAGYALASAEITLSGTLAREGERWLLVADSTGQRFALEGATLESTPGEVAHGARVEITGDWKTVGEKANAREVVAPRLLKKTADEEKARRAARSEKARRAARANRQAPAVNFVRVGFEDSRSEGAHFAGSLFARAADSHTPRDASVALEKPLAPIRTTSPGLTVYRGGAFTPRLYLVRQHVGGLDVTRQVLDVSVSYTPTPRLQLEVEVPFARTSFDDGAGDGAGLGLGNVTLWGKYRFYRSVKTYGDRQAAVRLGLELPTGKSDAPAESEVDAPAFVRQQLTPISGGFAPHLDVSLSQAGGRVIFGGNVEGVLRAEREGFRTGHELRVNTDLEYVLLPRDYGRPGRELFIIFETNFVWRGRGRVGGETVEDSKSTEFYLSPGLQYAADPRLVIEGSVQLPVVRNTGAQLLRTDVNLLLGMKYLF